MRALIVGGAACVHDDAERALRLFTPDAVFAINDQIADWPGRVDYAVTLHPEKLEKWMRERMARQRNPPQVWAHKAAKGIDRHTADWGGSSGLFAIKVAIEEGSTRAVLAGIPMDAAEAHYFDARQWTEVKRFIAAWGKHKGEIAPFVTSMSGWTRQELGEPTPAWLAT